MSKKKILKIIKGKIRESYIQQGGMDGRYAEKFIPNKKKKYNRQRNKKINEND